VCFTKGCQKYLCVKHAAQVVNPEENMMAGKICVECEPKMSQTFWMAFSFLLLLALLVALPGILIYGTDTGSIPPSVQ
jgi:hypothetical protein